jgi:hypothetical protein
MAVSTYILTTEDFTNRADISGNIITSKLNSYIGVIQEKYALKMLCQALYDELLDQICNNSLTTANTALLPFLKDYLIYKTYARYLVNSSIMSTPSGLRIQNDPTSQAATNEQLAPLVAQAENDANFYQDQLANFLIKNEDDYPLWKSSSCNCSPTQFTYKANQFSKIGGSTGKTKVKWT